mmetsp:Transcript_26002/g.56693  ORF Transcript_26002/g.56693 Transcript_26002/m.56693 type:complete len:286 (-) Transcript_26002:304-1161(-)
MPTAACPCSPVRSLPHGFHASGLLGTYHLHGCRVMRRAGEMKRSLWLDRKAGCESEPMHTMVLPLPVMKTALKADPPSFCSCCFRVSSSGRLSNAGCSRSLTASSWVTVCLLASEVSRCLGSAVLLRPRSRDLKILGVDRPTGGLTSSMGVERGSGGSTSSTISPRPVQYAAPLLKKTLMSLPISPDQVSRSSLLAGPPHSWLAAYKVVAALPLPPPKPAPCGTILSSLTWKKRLRPVLRLYRLSALMTRLESSEGMVGSLHTSTSLLLPSGRRENSMPSPRSIT